MITNYPTSIIVHGMALNITVQSYDKSLDFGLMADAHAMPDVRELADAITIAFDDLRALTRPGEAETDEAPPDGLVSQATKRLAGGLGKAFTGMVGKAAAAAVTTATTASRAAAPKSRRRAG
jgi:hypothetical protein